MAGGEIVTLFQARGRLCAVPAAQVVETMRPLAVTRIAALGEHVLGFSRIRGACVPVVDAGALLEGDDAASQPPGRFLLLRVADRAVALAVDAVSGVRVLPPGSLQALPPLLDEAGGALIERIGAADGEFLLVLRALRLLDTLPDAQAAHA